MRWLRRCVPVRTPDRHDPAPARARSRRIIPLKPQLAVVASAALFVALLTGAGLLAFVQGNTVQGMIWVALAVAGGWSLSPHLPGRGGRRPSTLWLQADGSLSLGFDDGSLEQVRLQASSLSLGNGMFLVLKGRSLHRLLLSAATVAPGDLAALRRRVRPLAGQLG
jgi:hypothetical protein